MVRKGEKKVQKWTNCYKSMSQYVLNCLSSYYLSVLKLKKGTFIFFVYILKQRKFYTDIWILQYSILLSDNLED